MKKVNTKFIQFFLFLLFLIGTVFIVGRNINLFGDRMFTFHDETQAARIQQFTLNLQHLQIPPRIAPDFSFGLGYPIFNFYAPFSYWVTSGINLLGFDVVNSLQISILLAILVSFTGMYVLMKQYVENAGSLLSAVVYTVSPYIAVEIFVRGNLAELWFYALLPWAFYVIKTNGQKRLLMSALVLSFLFTSHNVLSLLSVAIMFVFALFQEKKWLDIIAIVGGLLLSSYFLIPALSEINTVYASSVATITNYADHFLCLNQLWTGAWGFAGSAPGCDADGMSFMLGKANIVLGILGCISVLFLIYKKVDVKKYDVLFILLMTVVSTFLVTESSKGVWELTESISSIFQFPWRFLIFVVFGLAFFAGFITKVMPKMFVVIATVILAAGVMYTNYEYFYGNTLSKEEYTNKYLSEEYIKNEVAFKVAEYLPVTADYEKWRALEKYPEQIDTTLPIANTDAQDLQIITNEPFKKEFSLRSSTSTVLNIHYAYYWIIKEKDTWIVPSITNTDAFDSLGRQIVRTPDNSLLHFTIEYKQTFIQQLSNIISLVSLLALTMYTVTQYKPLWKHTKTKKH